MRGLTGQCERRMELRAERLMRGLARAMRAALGITRAMRAVRAARSAVRMGGVLALLGGLFVFILGMQARPSLAAVRSPESSPEPRIVRPHVAARRSVEPHAAAWQQAEPPLAVPPFVEPQSQKEAPAAALLSELVIPGWVPSSPPQKYERGGLYGYMDGGAEIFLQYGFREAVVLRFKPAGGAASTRESRADLKELAVEIYLMETPADAFGIFSVGRAGDERVSERVGTENWVSESQAAFVKGARYVNITATGTTEAELEAVAAAAEAGLPGEPNRGPSALDLLPEKDQVRPSRRYIRGELAANAEAPLFGADFWGFKDGRARAYSAKYGTSGSKLIVVDFGAERGDLASEVEALFREYLSDVARDGAVISARNAAGRYFLFRQAGRYATLILAEPDPATARARLDEALAGR